MIKALLIGCGNIGAGYDLNDPVKVWTHAKAYSLRKDIELTIFDENEERARQVANKYNAKLLGQLNDKDFGAYQLVSVTTPTNTHFSYLQKLLVANVPVVICEKPVVSDTIQASQLEQLYHSSNSKVLVNYIRRFQQGYQLAKERLLNISQAQSLTGIIIKYKRGFLNNASHAIDLLQFIFDKPLDFEKFQSTAIAFDAFEYDPTLTGSCIYQGIPVSFAGFANTTYPIFEIEIFFSSCKAVICHSGNEIRYYYDNDGNWSERSDERQTALLDTYMIPIIEKAISLYNGEGEDNFASSLHLNKTILDIIEPLKKKSNATISN